jgi:hypothetical protein
MLSQVKRARGHLAAVRTLLRSPSAEDVNRCIPLLHEAIACLGASEPTPELARELSALRFEVGVVRRLIERGAEFYQGWAKWMAAAAAGQAAMSYTETGNPAPRAAPGSLSVRG